MHKYFIAIIIPEPAQNEILSYKNHVAENYNSKAALRSPGHITLHMPFEWKEEKENILIDKLSAFKAAGPFQAGLKDFGCFAPRVIFVDVVKNEALENFQKQVVIHAKKELNLFNQSESMRGFHPHVTIAFRDLKKEMFHKAWDYFKDQKYSVSFSVNSFHLLKHTGKEWLPHHRFQFQ